MALTLVVNGVVREFPNLNPHARVDELVAELGLKGDRVAIEHNGQIAERGSWPTALLNPGDKLEIVHFVGGGSSTNTDAYIGN